MSGQLHEPRRPIEVDVWVRPEHAKQRRFIAQMRTLITAHREHLTVWREGAKA
ncbi:hypothetical protein BH11MYX3_BH11MYX3_35720 [soil metagenome]